MSRYAWLVCESDKTMIYLGKIITDQQSNTTYFNYRPGQDNSKNEELNKAIHKFLAERLNAQLTVWPEEMMEQKIDDEYKEIGEDAEIPIVEYIRDFRG